MKVTILGTGRVGVALGAHWLAAGHHVRFGSRAVPSPTAQHLAASFPKTCGTYSYAAAVNGTPLILLAIPFTSVLETLGSLGDLSNKVLIDCTNPLNDRFDGLRLGHVTSAAEQIAERFPTAQVVKAFNTVSVATMQQPNYGGEKATMFYCGDNQASMSQVRELIEAAGMEPVNAGPLVNARYLEPLAMLWIALAIHRKMGCDFALKLLQRPESSGTAKG